MAFVTTGRRAMMRLTPVRLSTPPLLAHPRIGIATTGAGPASSRLATPRQRLVRSAKLSTAPASATAEAVAEPLSYSGGVKLMHWIGGIGTLCCFATVQAAQRKWAPASEMMMYHKSVGLVLMGVILCRVPLRLKARVPAPLPGNALEHIAAKLSHVTLYALSVIMPVSGVTMGIFGGKGIPFFGLGTVPGLNPKETGLGWVAGRAFKLHKQAGQIFEYIVPIHIGAVGVHMAKGQAILSRIL